MDGYTKYTWIYFLHQKLEAFHAIKLFLSFVKTQLHTTTKALQLDYGGEFRSFTKFLSKLGIYHRLTCPYTSCQSGTVERKHRNIVEMGLILLSQSCIPMMFCDHSFSTSLHIINTLPTVGLLKLQSPFHALYNKLSNYHP